MVTSHEKTGDYIHFFKSLNKIASQLVPGPREDFQFKFEPKNIVSDAAKSIAKAIKRTYPSCVLIMCWFHLKYNLRKHKFCSQQKAILWFLIKLTVCTIVCVSLLLLFFFEKF